MRQTCARMGQATMHAPATQSSRLPETITPRLRRCLVAGLLPALSLLALLDRGN